MTITQWAVIRRWLINKGLPASVEELFDEKKITPPPVIHANLGPCGMDLVDTPCGKVLDAGSSYSNGIHGSITPMLWRDDHSEITCEECLEYVLSIKENLEP